MRKKKAGGRKEGRRDGRTAIIHGQTNRVDIQSQKEKLE